MMNTEIKEKDYMKPNETHLTWSSENIEKLAIALSKCQGEMEPASKDSENPFFKAKYADLASIWDTCRLPLSKNGLAVTQITNKSQNGMMSLTTILLHSSGQWIKGVLEMKPMKQDPQGYGSCLTYMRRYALSAMVGIAPEDDDAEKSMKRNNEKTNNTSSKPNNSDANLLLTFKELENKISKITNLKHLGNTWKKYQPDILALSEENQKALVQLKNESKVAMQKISEFKDYKSSTEKLNDMFGEDREPGEEG